MLSKIQITWSKCIYKRKLAQTKRKKGQIWLAILHSALCTHVQLYIVECIDLAWRMQMRRCLCVDGNILLLFVQCRHLNESALCMQTWNFLAFVNFMQLEG